MLGGAYGGKGERRKNMERYNNECYLFKLPPVYPDRGSRSSRRRRRGRRSRRRRRSSLEQQLSLTVEAAKVNQTEEDCNLKAEVEHREREGGKGGGLRN